MAKLTVLQKLVKGEPDLQWNIDFTLAYFAVYDIRDDLHKGLNPMLSNSQGLPTISGMIALFGRGHTKHHLALALQGGTCSCVELSDDVNDIRFLIMAATCTEDEAEEAEEYAAAWAFFEELAKPHREEVKPPCVEAVAAVEDDPFAASARSLGRLEEMSPEDRQASEDAFNEMVVYAATHRRGRRV